MASLWRQAEHWRVGGTLDELVGEFVMRTLCLCGVLTLLACLGRGR